MAGDAYRRPRFAFLGVFFAFRAALLFAIFFPRFFFAVLFTAFLVAFRGTFFVGLLAALALVVGLERALFVVESSSIAACAAASRAIGTRYGEQLT